MVTPKEILELGWSYMRSRVLFTAAELNVFTWLDRYHYTAPELAAELGTDPRATTRLLDALIALGLLSKEQGRYRLPESSRVLSDLHPESIRPMILHLNHIWKNWSQLTEAVRLGYNPGLKPVEEWDGEVQEAFIGAMHVIGRELAEEIADAYNLFPYRRLLDVGGASGTYTIAFLRRNPTLEAVLFDFAPVLTMAKKRLEEAGLLHRVELVAGDFYRDELPGDCDLALLSAIIHQNSPEENVALYQKVYRALIPGGKILIRDHIMDDSRTKPPAGALFALNMLVNTRGGDTYTFAEVKATLEQAGFQDVKLLRQGEKMDCLVEATKPC